ncbi:MAG: hypothetical protein GY943_16775 [Chloroflexi bacterium]|nr:hypothetical protein [Chloroflexota bacterium]
MAPLVFNQILVYVLGATAVALVGVTAVAVRFLLGYLQALRDESHQRQLELFARITVGDAEQRIAGNEAKRAHATTALTKHAERIGVNLPADLAETFVHGALKQLKMDDAAKLLDLIREIRE